MSSSSSSTVTICIFACLDAKKEQTSLFNKVVNISALFTTRMPNRIIGSDMYRVFKLIYGTGSDYGIQLSYGKISHVLPGSEFLIPWNNCS